MTNRNHLQWLAAVACVTLAAVLVAMAGTSMGSLTFTNTQLLRPDGSSEPELRVRADGTVGLVALSWENFVTHLWSASFGGAATFRGEVDSALQLPGRRLVFGGGDADVDLASTGTLHATTLIFLTPPTITTAQLGVSVITCTGFTLSAPSVPGGCRSQIIDTAGADRNWITSDASRVFVSYHDSGNSTLVHVQRSDDDGFTFRNVGDPIPGQGGTTADATFNNIQGPIVADPFTHNVYDIYAAGVPGFLKGRTATFDNIFVSRSTDGGAHWKAVFVFHNPLNTTLQNVFPALAVDPTNGQLHATWSDAHTVFYSTSNDEGLTWSSAVAVNIAPSNTAVFPWNAAHNGVVDVVYYGTSAASKDDPTAVWNVYMAQSTNSGLSFTQSLVSNTSNHTGVICTNGTGCARGTRNLLDLFQVAINPQNGKAAIIYTDDTISTFGGSPLPQVVLAQQN